MDQKNGKKNGKGKKAETPAIIPAIVPETKEPEVTDQTTETKETETPVAEPTFTTAETAYSLETEAIESALEAGHIRWAGSEPEKPGTRETALTEVKVKADAAKGRKAGSHSYQKLEALTLEGMVILAGGKLEPQALRGDTAKADTRSDADKKKGVPDHFNYGLDLEVKRAIRRKIEGKSVDPETAIKKMAALMVKLGIAKTENAALAMARAQYEAAQAEGAGDAGSDEEAEDE